MLLSSEVAVVLILIKTSENEYNDSSLKYEQSFLSFDNLSVELAKFSFKLYQTKIFKSVSDSLSDYLKVLTFNLSSLNR